MRITKDMTVARVIELEPKTIDVFQKYGMHCVDCEVAEWGTIEEAVSTHGIEDLDKLLGELNEACEGV